MPTGYGGFSWASNIGVYGWVQDPYNAQSAPNRVLFGLGSSGPAESLVFSNIGLIVFDGAYFAGVPPAGPVYFNLYLGGTKVSTSASLTPSNVPTFLSSGYSGQVDEIGIVGGNTGGFVMDNFTFQGVPEPGSLLLLGSGILLGLGRLKYHHIRRP